MSHSLGAKLSGLRHKGYITDDEYLRLKKALEQQPCEDAISREDTLKAIIENLGIRSKEYLLEAEKAVYKTVENMPSVTPQQKYGKCKDCRWWKDSDGVYRRGVGAGSQCPINCREVYEGNGYCFRFNPQESEE